MKILVAALVFAGGLAAIAPPAFAEGGFRPNVPSQFQSRIAVAVMPSVDIVNWRYARLMQVQLMSEGGMSIAAARGIRRSAWCAARICARS